MIFDKTLILNKLKNHYSFKKDSDFARFLEIKPQTLASWYSRNTFDIELLYSKCVEINPDWLLSGKGEMLRKNEISAGRTNDLVEKIRLLEEQNELLRESRDQSQEIITLYKEKINRLENLLGGNADKSQTA